MQAAPRLVHHECTAFHHRLKCIPSTAYRLTTFYLTRQILFWYTFGCSKVRPDACRGFFFFWTAVYPEPGRAALLPLFFCTGGACHALRLRSLRVLHFVAPASCWHLSFHFVALASCRHLSFHFVAPASCRHLSFLSELCALLSVVGACPDPVGVLSLCLFFCCSLSAAKLNFF